MIAVEYRLAPEHPFSAAPNDAYFATKYISDHASQWEGDATRLTVGGDSTGGNLAAIVSLMRKANDGPRISNLVMLYPVTDMRKGGKQRYPSYNENGQGNFLTEQTIKLFSQLYFQNPGDGENVYASPILAENIRGFPPTLIITAEFDPLRDEGEQYAIKLQEAGVRIDLYRAEGLIHGFFNLFSTMGANDDIIDVYEKIADFLRE